MPHQQNPERGPERPRSHGHRTATPDAPQLPRPRHETPSRPPANATPPGGRPATAPRRTPPSGVPTTGRPSPDQAPRPTRMMPGPGAPDVANARPTDSARPTDIVSPPVPGPPGSGGGPRGNGSSGSSGDGDSTTKQKKPESDLQFNKIVAGAGAAIVTAVLGSFLGAVGTIIGAALGSIITTVATTFFQRSIETTRAQVTDKSQKLRERRTARRPGDAAWQAAAADGGTGVAGPGSQETVRIDPSAVGATQVAPSSSGSRWKLRTMSRKQVLWSAVAAVLAFGLAMFLVTGIEWVKGSTITGGNSGTSIGNVANGTSTQQRSTDDQNSGTGTSTSESATSTSDPSTDQSDQSTGTSQNDGNGNSDSSTATSNPLGGLNNIVPTQGNESGQRQSGQGDGSNSGGGANSSN